MEYLFAEVDSLLSWCKKISAVDEAVTRGRPDWPRFGRTTGVIVLHIASPALADCNC